MTVKRYCGMCDEWFGRRVMECPKCGADTDKGEPEPAHKRATCVCGHGWTFDFQQRRVYCRTCDEAQPAANTPPSEQPGDSDVIRELRAIPRPGDGRTGRGAT
jgi:hypothetical protein